LLNGPAIGRRVAEYTAEHAVRLERIKRLQADGHTLLEIGRILSGPSAKKSTMEPPTAWWQHAIADDIIVWVRDGASPWRSKQLHAAMDEFARRVKPEKKTKG
jgi:DNA-binding transcriptional MerR regulator